MDRWASEPFITRSPRLRCSNSSFSSMFELLLMACFIRPGGTLPLLRETDEADITGDIYIGGGETDAMRLIARTAKELQADYPRIRYHLYSGNGEDVS